MAGLGAMGGGGLGSLFGGQNALQTLGGGGGNVGNYLQQPQNRQQFSFF